MMTVGQQIMGIVLIGVLVAIAAVAGWGIWFSIRNILASLKRDRQLRAGSSRHDWDPGILPAEASDLDLIRTWSSGRDCAICGGRLHERRFSSHHLALLEPDGTTRIWTDVPRERLTLALATSLPVCWNCHAAESLRRLHPDLVTDRENDGTPGDPR